MKRMILLSVLSALLVIPSLAQNLTNPKGCSPAGTWYGGSDYKYLITINPIMGVTSTPGERFAIRGEGVYDNVSFGYKAWTSWPGELVRTTDGRYVDHSISMFTTSSELPPPGNSYELDAVRGWMTFTDCNNIKINYDFFGGYLDLNKVPFVDQPDLNYLPPGGLQETYHRMPTTCPACSLAVPLSTLRQKR